MKGQRKPTALKIIEGERHKDRINKNEPKPVPKAPAIPAFIDSIAKAEWKRLGPQLEALGVLTKIDGVAFATLCQLVSRFIAIEAKITPDTLLVDKIVVTKKGEVFTEKKPTPLVNMSLQTAQQIRAFCSEFGVTPAGATKIIVPRAQTKDSL